MPPLQNLGLPYLTREMLAFENGVTFKLRVDLQSDTAATLALRGMTREATFEYKAIAAATSAITSTEFPLSDIPIYVTMEDTARALTQGACFVAISLLANGVVIQQLTSGYIYSQKALSWPNTQQVDLRPGGGHLTAVSGTDPAAGSSGEITVPTGEIWRIKNATISLTTSATVANRKVYLEMSPFAGGLITAISSYLQTASLVKFYSFAPLGYNGGETANFDVQANMPLDVWIDAGGTILFKAENIQSGDNFGTPTVYIEKYFTTP